MLETSPTSTPDTQLFRDVFNASPIGIAVEDLKGQPLFVNPSFCSMLGFSEEEMRSKHCVEFSPPEDAEKDWALFQRLKAGSVDHYQLEKRYFRRDGSLVWGYLSVSLLNSHPSPLVLAMVEDITEKKAAEEAPFKLAAIVESSEDAIVSKDLDGVVTSWNAGAQRIFGYTEQETIGRPIILIPPELQDDESKVFERLKAGEHIEPYETIRFTKAGGKVNVSVSLSPIKDSTGTIVGYSKIARDVTERKRAEQALAEMTRKLIKAQEQERARIGRELHDDINQRLAMLAVELEQLRDDPSEFQKRVEGLRKRVSEISNDVQALAHDLHSSKLEYLGVVAGMKSWCREFAERQRIEIDCKNDVSSVLPLEVGLSLFRVLQEAVYNAVKHSGVKRVEVQLSEHPNEVHLTITDKGMGFDVEAAMQGRGLGLTSMRERVRLLNGTITIDSTPMSGTTIHVRVPLASERVFQRTAV
jgi:PAS domain S-box-containing protein